MISVSGDRRCKSCGISWAPAVSKTAATAILALLTILLILALGRILLTWRNVIDSEVSTLLVNLVPFVAILPDIYAAIRV
jgi:hypothetical protein